MIGFAALLSLTGAIGLLLWWFSMPIFLPVTDAAEHFQEMVLDPAWIPVNLVGLISVILITLGFPSFWLKYHEKLKGPGTAGLVISSAGLVLFTAIQYYETLIWPAAAGVAPDLVRADGELVSGNAILFPLRTIGLVLFCTETIWLSLKIRKP